jgi:predicted GNAT family acetyltransferase
VFSVSAARTITIQIHGPGVCSCHPACGWCERGFLCIDEGGRIFWDKTCRARALRAVVATRGGRMVGVLKYDYRRQVLTSQCTYVTRSLRQAGLATFLWRAALRHDRPARVSVRVVSDRGKTLVCCLARRFRQVTWSVEEDGCRRLRKLK